MKDITELAIAERRIFGPDVLPFSNLRSKTNLSNLSSPFSFKKIDLIEDDNKKIVAIVMHSGEFLHDKKIFPIEQLAIDQTGITFGMNSDSKIAGKFYQVISDLLNNVSKEKEFNKEIPLVKSTITSCIVTLDFDHKDLFSSKLNSFLAKETSKSCASVVNNVAKVSIAPRSLSFDVNYAVTDKSLLDRGVSINTKQIAIEPRIGTALKDRRFYTTSPTDSETHLKLLSELEKKFKKRK